MSPRRNANPPKLKRWVSIETIDRGHVVASYDFPIHDVAPDQEQRQVIELQKDLVEVLTPLCVKGAEGVVAQIRVKDIEKKEAGSG